MLTGSGSWLLKISVSPVEPGLADAIIWDFVWRLQTSKKIVKLQWSLQEWGRPLNTAGGRKLFEAVASHCFRLEAQKRSLRRPLSESTLVSVVWACFTVSSCLLLSTADCAAGALAVRCVLLPCKLQSSILDNLHWVKWRVLLVFVWSSSLRSLLLV